MYQERLTKGKIIEYCWSVLRNHKVRDVLTGKEAEVLKLVAQHKFNKEVTEIFVGQPFWYGNHIICSPNSKCFFARFKDYSMPYNFSIKKTINSRISLEQVETEFKKYFE